MTFYVIFSQFFFLYKKLFKQLLKYFIIIKLYPYVHMIYVVTRTKNTIYLNICLTNNQSYKSYLAYLYSRSFKVVQFVQLTGYLHNSSLLNYPQVSTTILHRRAGGRSQSLSFICIGPALASVCLTVLQITWAQWGTGLAQLGKFIIANFTYTLPTQRYLVDTIRGPLLRESRGGRGIPGLAALGPLSGKGILH